jgi:hypothetical protein
VLILAWLSPKTVVQQLEVEIAELVVGGSAQSVACKPAVKRELLAALMSPSRGDGTAQSAPY